MPTTRTRLRFLSKQLNTVQDEVVLHRLLNAKTYVSDDFDDDGNPIKRSYVRYQTPLNINERAKLHLLKNEIEAILEECKDDGY
jgi:hypothetical protein